MRIVFPIPRTALLLIAVVIASCGEAEPEDARDRVGALVRSLVAAVEESEPRAILEHLDPSFRTDDGLTYADVQSVVLEFLVSGEGVGARLESLDLTSAGEADAFDVRARVRFARGTRLAERRLPPPPGSVSYQFDVRFRRIGGIWRATRGRYVRVAPESSPPSEGGPTTIPGAPETSTFVPGRACSRLT